MRVRRCRAYPRLVQCSFKRIDRKSASDPNEYCRTVCGSYSRVFVVCSVYEGRRVAPFVIEAHK